MNKSTTQRLLCAAAAVLTTWALLSSVVSLADAPLLAAGTVLLA